MKKACAVILLFALCFIFLIIPSPPTEEPFLSAEQVEALRERYPVYTQGPPTVEIHPVPFERLCERIDTFAYVEVTGDIKYYSKYSSNFYEYPAVVIDDTENIFKRGEEITIAANRMFYGYQPELSPGMKIVFAATGEWHKQGQHAFSKTGTYYITEDGFALSAFDEELYQIKEPLSGVSVKTLMRKLHKMLR